MRHQTRTNVIEIRALPMELEASSVKGWIQLIAALSYEAFKVSCFDGIFGWPCSHATDQLCNLRQWFWYHGKYLTNVVGLLPHPR